MSLSREERKLLHQKSKQPTFGHGNPDNQEGYEGDISFRQIEGSGTVEYVKQSNEWIAVASSGEMPAIRIVGGRGGGTVTGGVSSHGSLSGLGSDDHTQYLLIDGTRAMTSTMIIGADADDTDRSIVWGHTTLKTIMGIDDSADAFVINTDDAFDATLANNSFSIDASHNVIIAGDVSVGDDLSLTSDAAVFNMGDGNDFTITHDGTTGATLAGNPITITSGGAAIWSTSAGNLTVDSAAAVLVLDGHTGITLDASNSGDIEINVTAGDDIKIGNDAVAQSVLIGNSSATEVDLTAILVDINGGSSGVTIDGDVFINSPYADLKVSGTGGFDLTLGVTDPESDHGRVFGSGFADYYTNYVWVAMWDLQPSAEYDTDFGSW